MKELLIGCGRDRSKRVWDPGLGIQEGFEELTTLDVDADVKPDVIHNLDVLPYPFKTDEFDEIHAYEVLEHCGMQGDFRFFFDQFTELHRILKPGGFLLGSCPCWDGEWAWADPGHRRVISPRSFIFLDQRNYEACGQPGNAMADYRAFYKANFEVIHAGEDPNTPEAMNWYFILKAVKDDSAAE